MPPNHDGVFRTYVNAATINDAVLVPVYVDTDEGEAEALEAFAAAYPDREIIPIASSELIKLEGAVHCATLTIAR
jgi:agmatine deiminase